MTPRTLTKLSVPPLEAWISSSERADAAPRRPLLVLLHGFGAPGDDLVPLADSLTAPLVAFPEAPIKLQLPGWPPAGPQQGPRAWWMIDVGRFQQVASRGKLEELVSERPAGLDEAADAVRSVLSALRERFGVSPAEICLGGFSQGAMLATELALTAPEPFGALAIFSGSLVSAKTWAAGFAGRQWPVFVSHGRSDPILPFEVAQWLVRELEGPAPHNAPAEVSWVPFTGGHGITADVIAQFNAFWSRHFQHE